MIKRDFLSELKELAFASRLRRLSERLGRDVGRIYKELDVPFEAKWFSLFYLLSKYSPLSVTDAAVRLGISHAAVNQLAAQMERRNLISSEKSAEDERCRLLRISPSGKKRAKALVPVWNVIKQETEKLINAVDRNFLDALAAIETELDRSGMFERVMLSMDMTPHLKIEILPYRPAYKKHFKGINEIWLEKYFGIEAEDRRQLEDPNGQIIRKGGQILFAKVGNEIVGTCALVNHSNKIKELAKMGVTPEARGYGVGRRLAEEVILLARESGAEKLYLLTAPELKAAVKLYLDLGFKRKETTPLSACKYERCTFAMELELR